ncbi:hypothetical protein OBBRIDRAFT_48849 [Obba rivulosa]|uniref:Uncharacterized protein n=1 Tax=Obba rivulosa TaxID=1052685 RepID=A0A8E2DS57_9APHY|nr:hypothetical protein OBBRIDRAFT_48849 [Obba rivulosa]
MSARGPGSDRDPPGSNLSSDRSLRWVVAGLQYAEMSLEDFQPEPTDPALGARLLYAKARKSLSSIYRLALERGIISLPTRPQSSLSEPDAPDGFATLFLEADRNVSEPMDIDKLAPTSPAPPSESLDLLVATTPAPEASSPAAQLRPSVGNFRLMLVPPDTLEHIVHIIECGRVASCGTQYHHR